MTLYKTTGLEGEAVHGGVGKWPLPTDGLPGQWRTVQGSLKPLGSGLSLCEGRDLPRWLGPAIWEAEYAGECLRKKDKLVVRTARLIKRLTWGDEAAWAFARDCIEHVGMTADWELPRPMGPAMHVYASSAAMVALRNTLDVQEEREWQVARLFQYLNGEWETSKC